MSKTINATFLANYRSGAPRAVVYVEIVRRDAEVFRWVGTDRDVVIGSDTFEAAPGVQLSSLVSTDGFAVDNAEIKALESDTAIITRADILAGIWDGAEMEIGEVDWKAATPVKNILKTGTLGNSKAFRGYFTMEFRDLRQVMQGQHDTVLQPTCRYKLGDAKCTKDISAPPFTMPGEVTTATSQHQITDSTRTEVADYFGDGYLTFTTGGNAGLTQKVKTYAAGVFVFWHQFIYPIVVGDEFTVTAGCRFRPDEDCRDKFDNMINFGGERNSRNPDSLTAPAV